VTNKDIENAVRQLAELAQDKASQLDMLEDAEKRIENRLNEALLPRLVNYQLMHQVRFLEMKPEASKPDEGIRDERIPELPAG
jgi:hypothetical protein